MQGLWRPEAWGEVDVELELLDWKAPTGQARDVKLFDVPMAQQRYAFVLDVIKQHSAQSVVDLGCGDGKLLNFLLQQVSPRKQNRSPLLVNASQHIEETSAMDWIRSCKDTAAELLAMCFEERMHLRVGTFIYM